MDDQKEVGIESARFCPICGFEGNDLMCPVCNQKMESLDQEIDRIMEKEDEQKNDLLGKDVSLEDEKIKEELMEKSKDETGEDI